MPQPRMIDHARQTAQAPFSLIEHSMSEWLREVEHREALAPAEAWPDRERTPQRRRERIAAADADFWAFDRLYYPPELYRQGYSAPNEMQRAIASAFERPGFHWFLGFRKGGKTVTGKKCFAWQFLTGRHRLGGTLSQTLLTSQNILADIHELIGENPRIVEDYGIEVIENNADQLRFRVAHPGEKAFLAQIVAFSEKRSVKGFASMFARPGILLVDDIENRQSPLGEEHTNHRAAVLQEAKSSLTDDGVVVCFGNNFAEKTLSNRLLEAQERGALDPEWRIHVYPAWDPERGSAWPERYPATSEREMQQALKLTDAEWPGDGMQRPTPPDGDVFPREHWTEYSLLPKDAIGLIKVDQNLALKALGDTTAIGAWYYSPSTNCFYLGAGRCKSYSDPNVLLDDMLGMWNARTFMMVFDGHVNQESAWTNYIINWSRLRRRPFPRVEYQRVNADIKAVTVMGYWAQKRVKFPVGFDKTEEGKRFADQICAFTSKRANRTDDAPDCMIGGIDMLLSMGIAPDEQEQEQAARRSLDFVGITDPFRY